MATWRPYVALGVKEVETRFELKGGTYAGHADGDPGHDMSGDRAADFWTTSKAKHDQVIAWFVRDNFANARRLGMTYIISWRRIASVSRASEGIRPYTRYGPDAGASQAHTNHFHISWGNSAPSGGTPPPSEEDDMPLTDADVKKIWSGVRVVDNVWQPKADGSPGPPCLPSTALEEDGRDGNRIQAVLAAHGNQLGAIDKTLKAILAELAKSP